MDTTLEQPLINRVAGSGLVTIDLEELYPAGEIVPFDLKGYLFMEMILKEKDFREALKAHDWSIYTGKNLAVFCSADAIIPMWAYMLVASFAAPFAGDEARAVAAQDVEGPQADVAAGGEQVPLRDLIRVRELGVDDARAFAADFCAGLRCCNALPARLRGLSRFQGARGVLAMRTNA